MTRVLVNALGIAVDDVRRAVAHLDGVDIVPWGYAFAADVRSALAATPDDPGVRSRVPVPTDDQRAALATADAILGLDLPLDLPALAPGLRWVQLIGSGVDLCIPAGLPGSGVVVTNAAGVSAPGIAEFVIARLLEHWKLLREHAETQERRHWEMRFGRRVAGRTIVVVGLGAIGGAVAVLARALGMRVVAVRRSCPPGASDERVDEVHPADQLRDVVGLGDAVVLCATGSPENESLVSAEVFAAMRPDALFVNVSRGHLVDEDALVRALEEGRIAAAALDVTRREPLPADDPLWAVPNLRLSPHSATTMDGYAAGVVALFRDNLERFLEGRPLRNAVPM